MHSVLKIPNLRNRVEAVIEIAMAEFALEQTAFGQVCDQINYAETTRYRLKKKLEKSTTMMASFPAFLLNPIHMVE